MMSISREISTAEELETLMKEFPDWKEKFPDIYNEICPPRYSKINGKKDLAPVQARRKETFPNTDYTNTYRKHKAYRPRSTKRPPLSPRDPCPPPMEFDTSQRREFTPKDLNARAETVKMDQDYKAPEGSVEALSSYHRDYPVRKLEAEQRFTAADWQKQKPHMLTSTCRFDEASTSTTKAHYKPWHSAPVKPFSELPSFTGSILYPGRGHQLETTSGRTFQGTQGKRAELVKLSGGNIELDGDMDMNTTTRLTFKGFDPSTARPAQKIISQPMMVEKNRVKFSDQTQFKKDFPGYGGRQPKPPKPAEPAPETIDLKFDNEREFGTEQRRQFPGRDPKEFPAPKSCKKEGDSYKPPDDKFDVMSSQRRDYQPINIEEHHTGPVRPVAKRDTRQLPRLDDRTMNKQFFKRWEVAPRIRYGDFNEGHSYVPPADKFSAKTTNQDVFVGSSGDVPASFKPEHRRIANDGEHDFRTMYRTNFKQPQASRLLNKQQAAVLLKELRKMKVEGTAPSVRVT